MITGYTLIPLPNCSDNQDHFSTGIRKRRVEGNPYIADVSTSYVERQNLTMRMHMRRFTRLTNGFSKKIENHSYAVALHFMYYNLLEFIRRLNAPQLWRRELLTGYGK